MTVKPQNRTTARLQDHLLQDNNYRKMKKTILVDMDGVLVDIYTTFFELHEKEYRQKADNRDIAGLLEEEAFENQRRWVSTPGFFRYLPVMPGSSEALLRLK